MEIIRKAGKGVLLVYARMEKDWGVQLKDDQTPITEADRISNRIITEGLKQLFPDIPIISEENKQIPYEIRRQYEYFWLLDPLDGTKEFIKKNGEFTINLALINRTQAVAGFISVPCKGLIYYAVKGEGAYRIQVKSKAERKVNKPIGESPEKSSSVSKDAEASKNEEEISVTRLKVAEFSPEEPGLTVVASRSHFDSETKRFIEQLNNPRLISVGSSLKFMLLAEGQAHLYPRLSRTMEWDTAAGQAILEEAGGQVVEFSTRCPLSYNKESLVNPPFLATGKILNYEKKVW
ncbi:MAG: 3'(2'),5'-bisphosphate nucleotidase CysQ [Candidatus Aminicenantes bacterium]|nr:3'(2'),5'-bisphosphate nucleotidase CysQ [Candidatus Aminicenantes bacterium]